MAWRAERRGLAILLAVAFVAGGASGGAIGLVSATQAQGEQSLARLKARFRRPPAIPFPAHNPFTEPKRALGEMLFNDKRLSVDGSIACTSCHDRAKGFADGRERGRGVSGLRLGRHTPTLWNLAFAGPVFWDGRALTLEQQVFGPIEAPDEMAQPKAPLVARLAADRDYAQAFARAFPKDPKVTADNLARAVATFERTLVSPETRFDRFADGDDTALTAQEVEGFRLFAGKAGCVNCHNGFAFTDRGFYDIGLAGEDRGRGAVLRLPAAEHAFKTPSLRELKRSAPYMHDGSLPTLDAVVRHYDGGIVERKTLPTDLPRRLALTDAERAALVAFLGTLSTDDDPQPPTRIVATTTRSNVKAVRTTTISQHEKAFSSTHVAIRRGERLWILNNDTRTHNVRVFDRKFEFDSGAQEPGETVEIPFTVAGSFLVFCGIHPKMELTVDVGR